MRIMQMASTDVDAVSMSAASAKQLPPSARTRFRTRDDADDHEEI